MTHKTRGIILRTVKYGETSVITTAYTELFGVQSYIVKGVRQSGKKAAGKALYFQPAAMLEMVVYHNELRNLNFIKEYEWAVLYQNILFDVVKNAVASYVVELVLHTLKEPEANPELFYLVEDTLKQLDKGTQTLTANLPLYFTFQLAATLGFKIDGYYSADTPILDLQEGQFVAAKPVHGAFIETNLAETASKVLNINFYNDLETLQLTRVVRQQLMHALQLFMSLHVPNYGSIKSLPVLQELFS